jgi:hypothetical protein
LKPQKVFPLSEQASLHPAAMTGIENSHPDLVQSCMQAQTGAGPRDAAASALGMMSRSEAEPLRKPSRRGAVIQLDRLVASTITYGEKSRR